LAPSKTLTIDQKKTLSLCYRCGDEFFSRHKCKTKGIHVMEEDSLNDIEDHSQDSLLPPTHTELDSDNHAMIWMCASHNSIKHKTLKFQEKIGKLAIIAMVDSGSTHSFINPTIVHALSLPTVIFDNLTVITVGVLNYQLTHFVNT
jgi:hypothetical protein